MRKERRARLFKSGRPNVRKLQILDGEKYHPDVAILWIAYQKEPFPWMSKDLTQEQFAKALTEDELVVIEDKNLQFKTGKGIVTLVIQYNDGWKLEPHAIHLPWATKRNKLRSVVSYFNYVRYLKIGCCVVYTDEHESFFNKCGDYVALRRVGNIINGSPKGDVIVYSIRGQLNGIDQRGICP